MTELLFEPITGPESGEGSEWWKLDTRTDEELSNGILSNEPSVGTFYVHPFRVGDTTDFQIGNDVERIVFPSVNVKFDRLEIATDFPGIPLNYDEDLIRQLVFDVAETGINFSTSIESLEVLDTGQNTESFTRQPGEGEDPTEGPTEGPFDFFDINGTPVFIDAYVDGYYVGVNLSEVPTFSDGIVEIQHGGTFDLNKLSLPGNVLDPVYQSLIDLIPDLPDGLFTVDSTYTFKFDLNRITDDDDDDDDDDDVLKEINGGEGDDDDDDVLRGTNQRDLILVVDDDDDYTLIGSGNNDNLRGGEGDDILNGTGGGFVGKGEIDVLTGGNGKDTFVLGEDSTTYYQGRGDSDYAIVKDFEIDKDVFQLGSAPGDYVVNGDYTIGGQTGAGISLNDDLVAIVVGVSADDLVL